MEEFNEISDGEENSRFSSLESLPRGMRDFQRTCTVSSLIWVIKDRYLPGAINKKKESFVKSL